MTKKLIITMLYFLLGLVMIANSQNINDGTIENPDTCFTQEQLISIAKNVDELVQKDSINEEIINAQNRQILRYEFLHYQDSTLLVYKDQQVLLLNERLGLYKELYKPKWYDHKVVWIMVGAGTVIGASWVLSNSIP